jgi:hypothetical protein
MIIKLEKEDVIDDENNTLIVQSSSKIVIILNDKTITLKKIVNTNCQIYLKSK